MKLYDLMKPLAPRSKARARIIRENHPVLYYNDQALRESNRHFSANPQFQYFWPLLQLRRNDGGGSSFLYSIIQQLWPAMQDDSLHKCVLLLRALVASVMHRHWRIVVQYLQYEYAASPDELTRLASLDLACGFASSRVVSKNTFLEAFRTNNESFGPITIVLLCRILDIRVMILSYFSLVK